MTEEANRYVPGLKWAEPGPKIVASRWYWGYDADGKLKGRVKLTNDAKTRHEARGYTFKAVHE